MSYISTTTLPAPLAASAPCRPAWAVEPARSSGWLARANAGLSAALEAALLVLSLSGVSLVMSTVAAGAF